MDGKPRRSCSRSQDLKCVNRFVGHRRWSRTSVNISTAVEFTPVPSSSLVPPPFLASHSFPTGWEIPEATENVSWSFPKDFMLGVAGAAFQVEGDARAEGRGPSVWDKLTRVPGYAAENQTGDITDNHYFLYKQGEWPGLNISSPL